MKKTPSRPIPSGALAFLLAAVFTAPQSASAQLAPDLHRLQGHWVGEGPGGACSVTISGNSLLYTQPAADETKPDFFYETTFTLPPDTDPKQLHATILRNSSPEPADIGRVVVVLKIEDETLTLGVVEDFDGPVTKPIAGDWERTIDRYYLEKARP